MTDFLGKAGSLIIVIILSSGWEFTDILLNENRINDQQRLWILVGLTALLALRQVIIDIPEPAKRSLVEQRQRVVQPYLKNFLTSYYKILKRRLHSQSDVPAVRVNVMLPTKKF